MIYQYPLKTPIDVDRLKKSEGQPMFPIKNFYSFHKDANINYQLNRFLIPEMEDAFAEIGRQIETLDDWKRLFLAKANSFESKGEIAYAMELFRAAEFFMSPDDPDKMIASERFVNSFYQGKSGQNFERIAVPYEAGHLHGFKLTPHKLAKGMVIIHGGFDSYIEDLYLIGKAICESCYEVVMFNGPGQGSTLMREKIPMTPNWEKPVSAVPDYFNANNVTLIGMSLGGFLAIRAASLEPRVKRVIAYDVMLDFFACVTSRRGKLAELAIKTLVRLRLSFILNALARIMIKRDMYSRWGITQGMHVMACKTPYEFFSNLQLYNGYSVSGNVEGDVLIMAGAEDHFVPLKQYSEQLKLLTRARSVSGRIFIREEHAQSHCQVGNLGIAVDHIVGWIDEHTILSDCLK